MTLVAYILIAVFGAAFGSFFNVCIHRIPTRQSIAFPPSHCPSCHTPIKPWHNVPILGYLWLRGRCASCGCRIHWHYPLVEALTPILLMLVFHHTGESFGPDFWKFAIFFCVSLILFFIDLFHYLLPDVLTLPLIVLGIGFSLVPGTSVGWISALAGGAFGFVFFGVIGYGYALLRKREGLGGGDVKYIAAAGTFLGMPGILFAILFGSAAALIVAPAVMFLNRSDSGEDLRRRAFPFGPFLVLGAFLQVMLSGVVADGMLRLLPY